MNRTTVFFVKDVGIISILKPVEPSKKIEPEPEIIIYSDDENIEDEYNDSNDIIVKK